PATLFYDGACGLCHRALRFVLAEDRDGQGFRYAPLHGDAFLRRGGAGERAAPPHSLGLVTPPGPRRPPRAAPCQVGSPLGGSRLGGLWRVLAAFVRLVPAGLLDRGYDWIARRRKGMFAEPEGACPILPPDLRNRFD